MKRRLIHQVLCRNKSIGSAATFSSHVNTGADGVIKGSLVLSISQGGTAISVGDFAQVERIYSAEEVKEYGKLIGDDNPIHREPECNSNNDNENEASPKVIVHGIFSASLFSKIFGSLIPGSVYRRQSLSFLSPIYTNESVIGRVEVVEVKDLRRGFLVTCDTVVYKQAVTDEKGICMNKENYDCINGMEPCVEGTAEVWLPGYK